MRVIFFESEFVISWDNDANGYIKIIEIDVDFICIILVFFCVYIMLLGVCVCVYA